MEHELLIAFLTGFGGMLGWGFADFFAKKTVDKIGSIISLVWAHVFGTIVLGVVAITQLFIFNTFVAFPTDSSEWGILMVFGFLQMIVYLLLYKGFEKGQLAVLNPIFASYSGVVAILSIIFLGESLERMILVALIVIFVGVLFLNLDFRSLRARRISVMNTPGIKEVGAGAILAAIWTIGWDQFIGGKDWVTYAFLMYAFMTLAAYAIAKVQKVALFIKDRSLWKFFVLIGLCETVAYLAISLGYSATSLTSVVALLSGAFSLPTILLSRLFLKEKLLRSQTIGSIIIIIGIILLALK